MKERNLFLMKVAAFIAMAFMSMNAFASIASLQYDLRLSFRKAPVEQVLDEFTRQTGVTFTYANVLGKEILQSVNINASDADLDVLLNQVFKGTDIK